MGEMDKDMVYYKSDTFADCPELVENWKSYIGDMSTISIEKITCQNTSKK